MASVIPVPVLDKDVIVGEGAVIGAAADGPTDDDGTSLVAVGKEAVVAAGATLAPGTTVPVGGGRGARVEPSPLKVHGEWPR